MDDIRRLAEKIHLVSSNPLEGRPTAKDFHVAKNFSSADAEHDDSLWIRLLHESQICLSEFWLAIQNVGSALKALEPSSVVALSDAFPSNWTVQCQAAVDSSTSWLTWTRPRKGQDIDLSRFLSLAAKPVPDLSPAMFLLEQRMHELFALRGEAGTNSSAKTRLKRRGAPRQARTGKETAIVKAHKYGQRHDKTARLAGVFTRDGLPDVKLVQAVLNRESERKRRKSLKPFHESSFNSWKVTDREKKLALPLPVSQHRSDPRIRTWKPLIDSRPSGRHGVSRLLVAREFCNE